MLRIRKMCYYAGICVMLFVCGGCGASGKEELQEITEEQLEEPEKDRKEAEEKMQPEEEKEKTDTVQFVHVCGAVKKPGVYKMPAGSRIYEALEAAGGIREDADGNALNLAEILEDGQRVCVPTKEESASANPQDSSGQPGKININTAAMEQLMTLTGIGEAKAQSIIRYREEHGKFRSIEELMNIEGIKSGVFHKIKEQIAVK